MLPNFKQRLAMAAVAILGGTLLVWGADLLVASDGSGGLVLLQARLGPALATAVLIGLLVPVVALALVVAAMGNKLGGVFTLAAALAMLGIAGGPADGWYWRSSLPGGYWLLAIEAALWGGGWIGALALIERFTQPIAARLPAALRSATPSHATPWRWPKQRALVGALVAAVVGAVLSSMLLRSTDVGQVTGALVLGFTIGGLVARATVPGATATGILLSPLLAAIAGYIYLATQFVTADQVLAAWYADQLLGLGSALPIHYAAAGVVGTTLGVGLGQAMEHNYHETAREAGESVAVSGTE
jgi:hypothetical protein